MADNVFKINSLAGEVINDLQLHEQACLLDFCDEDTLEYEDDGLDDGDVDLEEEYDALNSETFGAEALDDWEESHNRYVQDNRRDRSELEDDNESDFDPQYYHAFESLLQEDDETRYSTPQAAKLPPTPNFPSMAGNLNAPYMSGIGELGKLKDASAPSAFHTVSTPLQLLPPQLPRVPLANVKTVEELERDLLQRTRSNADNVSKPGSQAHHFQPNHHNKMPPGGPSNKFPPGFGPQQGKGSFQMQPSQDMMRMSGNQNMSPMTMVVPPHYLPPHLVHSPRHLMMNPPSNMLRYMPSRPILIPQQQQQQQHRDEQHNQHMRQGHHDSNRNGTFGQAQQQTRYFHSNHHGSYQQRSGRRSDDEYAGLMSNRERQWLLNIQMLQLSTTQPHVDDYYYTNWVKKQEAQQKKRRNEEFKNLNKNKKDRQPREPFFTNNRQANENQSNRERKDSERDLTPTPSPRVYVPLQFENSLGKLQCGSVTAPRKIIDKDVVSEPQSEAAHVNPRDSKKTKYVLLEIEKFFLSLMTLEELEAESESKEKNVVGACGDSSNAADVMTKPEIIKEIMAVYLNEDKFLNFVCVRKGKTLLLRLFPFLDNTMHADIYHIWHRFLRFISIINRKDQSDNILLRFLPYFHSWASRATFKDLFSLCSLLQQNTNQNVIKTSRSGSPSPMKNILPYVCSSQFGISMVCTILRQVEEVYPDLEAKEKSDWCNFITNFVVNMSSLPNIDQIACPIQPMPTNVVNDMLSRCGGLHIGQYALANKTLSAVDKENS